jgi:hypothetical protein
MYKKEKEPSIISRTAMAEGRYVGRNEKRRRMKCLEEAKQKQNMKA